MMMMMMTVNTVFILLLCCTHSGIYRIHFHDSFFGGGAVRDPTRALPLDPTEDFTPDPHTHPNVAPKLQL